MEATHQQEVMVFRLRAQVFEDTLLPKAFHVIPIFYYAMFYGIVQCIRLGISNGFIANEEI